MTIHLCQSPKKLTWKQIKQSILGRHRLVDKYNCGGCSRTFETLCCLHFHCMKHCEGGSYVFDHVTSTAFPKFDMRCSATQFDAEDSSNVMLNLKVLTGHARSINSARQITTSHRLKKNDPDIEELAKSDTETSDDNDRVSFKAKTRHQKEKASEEDVDDGTKEKKNVAEDRKEREGFAFVKVRNIEKREDGSITFEMNEDDADLFQVTANTIIEQLKRNGGDILETDQEFEVLVPDDSLRLRDTIAGEAVTHFDKPSTSDLDCVQVPCSSVTDKYKQTESDKDTVRDSVVTPEEGENSSCTVSPPRKENYVDNGSSESDSEQDTDKSKESSDTNVTKDCKTDSDEHSVKDAKKRLGMKKKVINTFDDTCALDKISLEQTKMKALESELKVANDMQNDIFVHTRSVRKRKLTTKMKESELPDIMKVTKRQPEQKQNVTYLLTSKETKRTPNTGETDFIAGETLLSLREIGDLKQIKRSRCEYVESSVIGKEVTKAIEQEKHPMYYATTVSNIDENKDEGFDFEKKGDMDIAKIVVNELDQSEKSVENCQTALMGEDDESLEQVENGDDKKIIGTENESFDSYKKADRMEAEVLDKSQNQYFPKKQRQKRAKVGKSCKRTDFECEVCGKVGTLNMVRYHEQMHSDKMPYKCEECGKCFKTAACRRSHALQHGEKKWKCELCPAAFYRKQYLEVHMTNHTGEYPYVCELCGQKFKMTYILRRHVNSVHKNIRNYKCDICDKEFFRVATRNQHRNRHFDPFLQCSYCPKKFKGDLDLRKHELTHTGEKIYFCPRCNQGFTQIWPYYKHMWKIHNIEKEEAKKIKIKNPDIVNMRNINKDAAKKEPSYEHEFIGKPGCTFDMRKSFSQNVKRLKMMERDSQSQGHGESYEYAKGICDSNIQNEANRIYAETSSDVTDTIVLDIGEDLDTSETIVIQTEDVPIVDNQQTGYIVVDNGHAGGNIVIYSDLPQNEIEDVREYTAMDI
ncbi:uncharacterized protein LOC123561859 [Mercenaria mercenaria]|uniref:uncharacterized protein LOC123561859 n=1 Tax=Mercenaria mercenaria TaxID=6596 RepID=UPI00234E9C5F|nr:uncharacterized protein LOC123561859 [Mercenaria mercenaria]